MLWLDGTPLDGNVAPFDLTDRGLMLGDGVFDTAFVLEGALVLGARHLDRLEASCVALGLPLDRAALEATLRDVTARVSTGALRITVTRGAGPRGLLPPAKARPRCIISATPGVPATLWQPLDAAFTTIRRNETSPAARHKCLTYMDAILALQEVAPLGAQEAIFCNTTGQLACAATGNLFCLSGDRLLTPPLQAGILPGTIRATLLELAPGLGLTPVEAPLPPEELNRADGVFLTNSLRLMAPLRRLDGTPLSRNGWDRMADLAQVLCRRIDPATTAPWLAEGPRGWATAD
ncbi:aminotransferase class IV [Pseudooceanicola sp. CBS1P-1]|uniref:Probable branched-chain-amino-acid aminotransferase n=1 Tax=Pseudooceanicola albus TaxID=2692189 RepID=A0A6L7G2C8_9RHOB|nr:MULTISPECIES: aminotransferase class IV [Pseudooceanicola]MBT9383753.1 aminotransferase class IV [Pseudooceanicola endophyticus]MXN17607.1 class IV aminotransferase [Pseudooceanicola albus]